MVLGVQKGGTTSLCTRLHLHPHIVYPKKKERMCFQADFREDNPLCLDSYYTKYKAWELPGGGFDPIKLLANPKMIDGDCSPGYLYNPQKVIPRIKPYFPWLKFIVLLRDPVARAFSQFQMNVRNMKVDPGTNFGDVVIEEMNKLWENGLLPQFQLK